MFGEEETLSVNSRSLNESINVAGIFRHRQLDAPDLSCQRHKTPFRSRAPVRCRPKTLGRENKYPSLKKNKEYCMNGVLSSNQKLISFSMEMELYKYPTQLLMYARYFESQQLHDRHVVIS